ncbi:MAG: hypothetical protein M3400_05495 [Actinomycetota bacterium]|nr:hypothetical protein [Actinomycetota bacterium]
MTGDLDDEALFAALPGRPVRSYPALLSTESDAMAWARAGAAAGSVVVADYQASPRGRAGLMWQVSPGKGLGFSMVLRPDLPPEREGWCYLVASVALSDVVGGAHTALRWPDGVEELTGAAVADLGLHVTLGPARTEWVTVTVLVADAEPPRAMLLAELVAAIEQRLEQPAQTVLDDYRSRSATIGTAVRARLIPLGPGGPEVSGQAVDVLDDGALVILTERGHRVAVRPQNLGLLGPPESDPAEPN